MGLAQDRLTLGLPLIAALYPQARVLACVRSVAWIMDSFERLVRRNAFEPSLEAWARKLSAQQVVQAFAGASRQAGRNHVQRERIELVAVELVLLLRR